MKSLLACFLAIFPSFIISKAYAIENIYPCENTSLTLEIDSFVAIKTSYPPFTGFNSIKIKYQSISALDDYSFANFCIHSLDLSNNEIENVSARAFASLFDLTTLFIMNNDLTSLTNILDSIDSSSLTTLDASRNKIEQVRVRFSPQFVRIRFENNKLTSIDETSFQNLTKLEYLSFRANQVNKIATWAFAGLESLTVLDLSVNMIETIERGLFRDTKKLLSLYLYSNRLSQLEPDLFADLPNLKYLYLYNNNLRSIDQSVFTGLSATATLMLNYNKIESVSSGCFAQLKGLKRIFMVQMKLKKIEPAAFAGLSQVDLIVLDFNQLTELNGDMFKEVTKLQRLQVENNVLSRVESNSFSNLVNLGSVYLRNNQLKSIEPNTFVRLSNMLSVYLSNNLIKSVPALSFVDLPLLQTLLLDTNLIDSIEPSAFVNLSKLVTLDLSNNKLRVVKSYYFKNLTTISVLLLKQNGINLIETGSFESLIQAKLLDLSDNFILAIQPGAFRGMNLNALLLDKNQIEHINGSFFINSRIITISMENIGLTALEPCSMSTLVNVSEMSFGFNRLKSIASNLFCSSSASRLSLLDLSNNLIRSLEFLSSGRQFSSLLSLNLECNLIETLSLADFSGLARLQTINVGHNPLVSIEPFFFKQTNLLQLNLSSIELWQRVELNLDEFPKSVQKIELSANALEVVNLPRNSTPLSNLVFLSLRANNLTSLQNLTTRSLNALSTLDLSDNPFQADAFDSFNWSALNKLTTLNLANTNRRDLASLQRFSSSNTLNSLNVSNNAIESLDNVIFQFNMLKSLDASNNRIERVTEAFFSKRAQVFTLYLKNNSLSQFPYVFPRCTTIDLSFNRLQSIDTKLDVKLAVLTILDLTANQIHSLDFDNIFDSGSKLTELYLAQNRLTEISANLFNYFDQLEVLDLGSNAIGRVDMNAFVNMDRLQRLNLAENNLTDLQSNTFKNQLQLDSLNLSFNRLEYVREELFANLFNLKTLDLSHNTLRYIENYSFKLVNLLETIVLDANPDLELSEHSFDGFESIKTISIGFHVLEKGNNKKSLLAALNPKMLKNVGELLFYRAISLTYSDELSVDCRLVLEFLKNMIQVNLRSDYDFLLFSQACLDIFLY